MNEVVAWGADDQGLAPHSRHECCPCRLACSWVSTRNWC